jgi:hypothetical protein
VRVCRRGHSAETGKPCKQCHSIAQQRYAHTERGRAVLKKYRVSPKGKTRVWASRYRRYHYSDWGDLIRRKSRDWYARNQERRKRVMRKYDAKMRSFGSKVMAFWIRQGRNSA